MSDPSRQRELPMAPSCCASGISRKPSGCSARACSSPPVTLTSTTIPAPAHLPPGLPLACQLRTKQTALQQMIHPTATQPHGKVAIRTEQFVPKTKSNLTVIGRLSLCPFRTAPLPPALSLGANGYADPQPALPRQTTNPGFPAVLNSATHLTFTRHLSTKNQ